MEVEIHSFAHNYVVYPLGQVGKYVAAARYINQGETGQWQLYDYTVKLGPGIDILNSRLWATIPNRGVEDLFEHIRDRFRSK